MLRLSLLFTRLLIWSWISFAVNSILFVLSFILIDGFISFTSFIEISFLSIKKDLTSKFIFEVSTFIFDFVSSKFKFGIFKVFDSIEVFPLSIFKPFTTISAFFELRFILDFLSIKLIFSFETSILFISKTPLSKFSLSRFIFVFFVDTDNLFLLSM